MLTTASRARNANGPSGVLELLNIKKKKKKLKCDVAATFFMIVLSIGLTFSICLSSLNSRESLTRLKSLRFVSPRFSQTISK